MLVIELDGFSHVREDVQIKDETMEKRLNELGITVLRFQYEEIYKNVENVLREIEAYIEWFEKKVL